MQGLDRISENVSVFNKIVLDQSSAVLDLSVNVILELVVCSTQSFTRYVGQQIIQKFINNILNSGLDLGAASVLSDVLKLLQNIQSSAAYDPQRRIRYQYLVNNFSIED